MTSTVETRPATPLLGKTALVTGGARGLGEAISRRLASAGARVALVGRDKDRLAALAAELPHEPLVVPADLAEPDAPLAALDAAVTEFGRLDVLVNNAGLSLGGPSHLLTAADLDRIFALNVRAGLLLAAHGAPHIAEAGGGSIVFLSSVLSHRGTPGAVPYAASKGALDAATKALAAEWGPSGVRVNSVRPGVTRTDMVAGFANDPAVQAAYLRRVPLGRYGDPSDVAETVLFLSSPVSAYLTGLLIDVDGGWSATAPSVRAAG
ncbi:MAG TPA: SDR family oxidoreductase [Pseudonocardia sp.]|jgi:NAD(P)-dependent dehydrogenase (short-subunit alcohol dehydrogenase family)|nr:SDR family oxidoreductase [Pseudonocardia sp.]